MGGSGTATWLLSTGTLVDGYRVTRPLGRGGFGEVYLARDVKLGRRVALKILRAKRAASKKAMDRFLLEARITARFNHPHIVTVFGFGEHEGRPYVALEYVHGHTLRERIDEERPSSREVRRLAAAIADALREAHENKILHLDLKPRNVLIGKDGRLRVLDFGLARLMLSAEAKEAAKRAGIAVGGGATPRDGKAKIIGTPAYLAPEGWRGEDPSPATDVWALGVILFELTTGRRPFPAPDVEGCRKAVLDDQPAPRIDAPEHGLELEELIARCLAKDPAARPSAEEIVALLRVGRGDDDESPEEQAPFRGLLPFSARHAAFFFGRDAEVAAFVERLRDEPVLPVVGPSGAGKSSFVQAGVLPRLRESDTWHVITMRPGGSPFETLAAKLFRGATRSASRSMGRGEERHDGGARPATPSMGASEGELAAKLRESPHRLGLVLGELAAEHVCHVALFVDQLEELCTLCDDATRDLFMRMLCLAADDPREPVRVVFTLRDDFLVRLATDPVAREALSRVTVIDRPEAGALHAILTEPVRRLGYRYDDDALVPEMVDAVVQERGALPLLQFTARQLWEQRDRDGRTLRRADYEALGGVAGALATHADGLLQTMPHEHVQIARRVLLRLVHADGTRAVLPRGDATAGLDDDADDVLRTLIRGRLVAVRRAHGSDDGELELAHESLVAGWNRLARWVAEGRDELRFVAETRAAAEVWDRRGRRLDEVWSGEALTDALRTRERLDAALPPLVAAFLDMGERAARLRAGRVRGGLSAAFLVLLAISVVLGVQRREARKQRDAARRAQSVAEEERLAAKRRWAEALREGARAALLQQRPLEARAKLRSSLESEDAVLGRALWWQLQNEALAWRHDAGSLVQSVAVAPDASRVAVGCQDGSIHVLDTARAVRIATLRGHRDQVLSLAFVGSADRLLAGDYAGGLKMWRIGPGTHRVLPGHEGAVRTIAVSRDGKTAVTGGADGRLQAVDLASGERRTTRTSKQGEVRAVVIGPDGSWFAAGVGQAITRHHADGRVETLEGHEGAVHTLALSPDGTKLVSGSVDRTVRLWNVADGKALGTWRGHASNVAALAFVDAGRRVVSASWDKSVAVWDAESGTLLRRLDGHTSGVVALAEAGDGRVVSGSWDHSVRLWNARLDGVREGPGPHASGVYGVAFRSDGKRVASAGLDKTVRVWDVESGRVERVFEGHRSAVNDVLFAPGGRLLSASADDTIVVWNPTSGRQERVLRGHRGEVTQLALVPGTTTLVSGSSDKTLRTWDIATGATLGSFEGHTGSVWSVSASADGKQLLSSSDDGTVRVWNLDGGASEVHRGHGTTVTGSVFDRRAPGVFYSGGDDKTVRRWETAGEGRVLGRHDGRVYWLDASPDGTRVAAPDSAGAIGMYRTGGPPARWQGHRGEVNFVRFDSSGSALVSGGDDGTVRLWDVSTGRPRWHTTALLRTPLALLTHRGWRALGPKPPSEAAWRAAIGAGTRLVRQSDDGAVVCLEGHDGSLTVWSTERDAVVGRHDAGRSEALEATRAGCVALRGGVVTRVWTKPEVLARDVRAIAVRGADVWFVRGGAIEGPGGARESVGAGVTSLTVEEGRRLIGYRDGTVEVRGPGVPLTMRGSLSSSITRLQGGPMGLVIAGSASGRLDVFDGARGRRLRSFRLHGPVMHLLRVGATVHAASELGDHRALDLAAFERPRCELLRDVWEAVPVVWEGGSAKQAPKPLGHACAAVSP